MRHWLPDPLPERPPLDEGVRAVIVVVVLLLLSGCGVLLPGGVPYTNSHGVLVVDPSTCHFDPVTCE